MRTMADFIKLYSPDDYLEFIGQKRTGRDVAVIQFEDLQPQPFRRTVQIDYYAVFYHPDEHIEFVYGTEPIKFGNGSLIFMAPGQIIKPVDTIIPVKLKGYALVFSPSALENTHLAKTISEYTFFNYEVTEALEMDDCEKERIKMLFHQIHLELQKPIDSFTHDIISLQIELFLKKCMRYYSKQFSTTMQKKNNILNEFDLLLRNYFQTDNPKKLGLPSVSYCAGQLHLSPNYFGDLVKQLTGTSPQEFIQATIINVAKSLIFDPQRSLAEVSESLGFRTPQHFTAMFKRRTGMTPSQYKKKGKE